MGSVKWNTDNISKYLSDIDMYIVDRSREFSANSINDFIEQCKLTLKSIVGEIDEQRTVYLC